MNNPRKTIRPCCQLNDTTTCNQKTKVYSRVVGYIRPVEDWNAAKQQEFEDRQTYAINETSTPSAD
jgi:ribonucleoside-triphosphate reductase (formate)